jgi:hypothetical protein
MRAVAAEIVMLSLFTIGRDRRACAGKALHGVLKRNVIERGEFAVLTVSLFDPLHGRNGPGIRPMGSVGIVIGVGLTIVAVLLKA